MYKVTVYFDNMVDEEYSFKKEGDAAECYDNLKRKYRGRRLYSVRLEEVK